MDDVLHLGVGGGNGLDCAIKMCGEVGVGKLREIKKYKEGAYIAQGLG